MRKSITSLRNASLLCVFQRLHAEVPLVAFWGLVHLRIPLPLLILGGAGCCDQGGVDDRALLHHHSDGLEVGFDHLKDLA